MMQSPDERKYDCVVCGSCVADVLVRPFPLDEPIGPGRATMVDPIEVTTGGIVSNSGIAMSRLIPAGTATQGLLSRPPASMRSTLSLPVAVRRLARTQPAVPAPTMM